MERLVSKIKGRDSKQQKKPDKKKSGKKKQEKQSKPAKAGNPCKACGGNGKSTKGTVCQPCNGTGRLTKQEANQQFKGTGTGGLMPGVKKEPTAEEKKAAEEKKKAEEERKAKEKEAREEAKRKLRRRAGSKSELRFSPYAWAKLKWLQRRGDTEISVFGQSRIADLLYVEDVHLVKQEASSSHFEFDDDDLQRHMLEMFQKGFQPCECMRIWIHTHPCDAGPSAKDWSTFARTTGEADWGIMCIIGENDDVSALLRISVANNKLSYDKDLTVTVDYTGEFSGVCQDDADEWEEQYQEMIEEYTWVSTQSSGVQSRGGSGWNRQAWGRGMHDDHGYGDYAMGMGYGADCFDYRDDYYKNHDGSAPQAQPDDSWHEWNVRFKTNQVVHHISEEEGDKTQTVWTDDYWVTFPIEEILTTSEGDMIKDLEDIALIEPLMWGQAEREYQGKTTLFRAVSIYVGNCIFERLQSAGPAKELDEDKGVIIPVNPDEPGEEEPEPEPEEAEGKVLTLEEAFEKAEAEVEKTEAAVAAARAQVEAELAEREGSIP